MSVKIGHASIDERGKASGGKAGDQTGKEVCTRTWYNKGWNKVIRPRREEVAKKLVKAMKTACQNDNIGYDQSQRHTLYNLAKAKKWDLAAVNEKCETDCSALVAVCINAAGIKVPSTIYTGNQAAVLQKTGEFDILTDAQYTKSDKKLKPGDILLEGRSHTAIVLSTDK